MAALSELFGQARKTRLRAQLLRAEMKRLEARNTAMRREHLAYRPTCVVSARRAAHNREYLPTWPAWSAPGPELRSTLVPLD